MIKTAFTQLLNIEFPVIMAPMFLVSNEAMIKSAMKSGIAGVFPTLNFRKDGELDTILNNLNLYADEKTNKGIYGVNLIVQKTNPLYKKHLDICISNKVPFYITSLGNPSEVINAAHQYGAKVFCDVTNLHHAKRCAESGCDGFIAVGQGAGGHAGTYALTVLIPALRKLYPHIPAIAAGGVATGDGILSMLALGASGVSIGTLFIASREATVSEEYKNAIIKYGMEDIVLTDRLSGTPCNIINTPYAQKIGTHQNFFERWMGKNSRTKKYFKMLVQVRGMQKLENAVKPGNYKNLWCAGQSSELVEQIESCDKIIDKLKNQTAESYRLLKSSFNES